MHPISRRLFLKGTAVLGGNAVARPLRRKALLNPASTPIGGLGTSSPLHHLAGSMPEPLTVVGTTPADTAARGPANRASQNGYILDTPIYGGELQYFRMSPEKIPTRLELCQRAAYTVIQTYVPWNVHEFFPGIYDFTGRTHPVLPNDHHIDPTEYEDPVRNIPSGGIDGRLGILCNTNLQGFLELCQKMGFYVILRPGPNISDEWRNGGLPDWFLESAPVDMFEYGPDGSPLTPGAPWSSPPESSAALGGMSEYYFPAPSYVSPYYLSAARTWLQHFAQFVKPWLATTGGPVIAVQVDDETCYAYRFGPFEVDYNPAMVQRYTEETGELPPRSWPAPQEGVGSLAPALRWQKFKGRQVGVFLGTLAADLRQASVEVPITQEMELSLAPPASFAADASTVLVQPELYPGANGPEAIPLIELTANAARAAQRNQINIWSAETQSSEVLLYTIALGEGIIGSLQFNYTHGVDSADLGPVATLGRAERTAGRLLTESKRRADVAIIWDNDLAHAPFDSRRWGFHTDVRAVIDHDVPALATLLIRSGLAFDLLDTSAAQPEDYDAYPTIFLACADILPRTTQQNLVAYVRRGGRLVCWPAPPSLDEDLSSCTVLANACFPEKTAGFYPGDAQRIEILGTTVSVWQGVQTFALSNQSKAIATRNAAPCGYERRVGAGSAVLLGTWLVATSIPGRAGEVLEQVNAPHVPTAGPARKAAQEKSLQVARELASKHFGEEASKLVPEVLPGGPAHTYIIYAYTNQRRGGSYYVAGGALAYWNGDHVVGLLELTTADSGLPRVLQRLPYRPIGAAHVKVAQAISGVRPQVYVSDLRCQARILDGPIPGSATLVANNRWADQIELSLSTQVGSRSVRFPTKGKLRIPAKTGLLLPIGYPLANGATLVQASAQLLGSGAAGDSAISLDLWAPCGGELVISLPGRLSSASMEGKVVSPTAISGNEVSFALPPGTHGLSVSWQ